MFQTPIRGVKAGRTTGARRMDTLHESDAAAAATELYWGSDKSVNQIAEELELSKSALYGLIRPMPAGLGCPECGQEAVSPNRTARDKELLACPGCGWEGPESAANSFGGEGAVTLPTYAPVDAIDDGWQRILASRQGRRCTVRTCFPTCRAFAMPYWSISRP